MGISFESGFFQFRTRHAQLTFATVNQDQVGKNLALADEYRRPRTGNSVPGFTAGFVHEFFAIPAG